MAPTRALINFHSSQHPQHESTGINSSSLKKRVREKVFFDIRDFSTLQLFILLLQSTMRVPKSVRTSFKKRKGDKVPMPKFFHVLRRHDGVSIFFTSCGLRESSSRHKNSKRKPKPEKTINFDKQAGTQSQHLSQFYGNPPKVNLC